MSTRTFAARNPDFERVVRNSFARQGFLIGLGARLSRVEPGNVAINLPVSGRVGQQEGSVHGGAIGAIGDSAGGYAALSLMPAGSEVVTVEYKINFVRPAIGTELEAVGRVLRAGRSLTVCHVDVIAKTDDDKAQAEAVAIMQATFMRIDAPENAA